MAIARRRAQTAALVAGAVLGAVIAVLLTAPLASGGPIAVRVVSAKGRIVPIPASVPHQAGAMIDRRLIGDLRYLASHFAIYISEGYAGRLPQNPAKVVGCARCHVSNSDHKNGLAVDIGPRVWSGRCDVHWKGVTRLARWAEPVQNRPRAPFRWVGYEGDSGHGCGNHLHLSWNHAEAKPFRVAAWVQVFRGAPKVDAGGGDSGGDGSRGHSGPSGGVKPTRRHGEPPPATGGVGPGD